MAVQPFDRVTRRVYAYIYEGVIVYIGSSSCSLKTLEYNHRNALVKYAKEIAQGKKPTRFRQTLHDDVDLKQGEFKTILEIEGITQPEIEDLEGQLIRFYNRPMYNDDENPVATSRWRKRY